MRLILFIYLFFLFSATVAQAQREANVWYFGDSAGVSFNSEYAIPLLDGNFDTWEGVATICDTKGQLLFYTEGTTVWNRNHERMPNGYGLLGHYSSTESGIIVPKPNDPNLYYLFTVDWEAHTNGLRYSEIDMSRDGGLGDVTYRKNILLQTPVPEKITAVLHQNQTDIWVIAHGWNNNIFYAYLVTEAGINTVPVESAVGTSHIPLGGDNFNTLGYMRASPDGRKVALALMETRIFEIYDFDNATGKLSNPVTIPTYFLFPYGVEFSPDGSKLYTSSGTGIHQINLQAGNASEIIQSFTEIGQAPDSKYTFGALQLAPDGRIYIAHDQQEYLATIENPNASVASCDFQLQGFYLGGKRSRLGLPNFIQSYFIPPEIQVSNNCLNSDTQFSIADPTGIISQTWEFGDFASPNNSSTELAPTHSYSAVGLYKITLTVTHAGGTAVFYRQVKINELPVIRSIGDTSICPQANVELWASAENADYLWQDGTTIDSFYNASLATTYNVQATDQYTGCRQTEEIVVSHYPLPTIDLGVDRSVCYNANLVLHATNSNASYLWQDLSTADTLLVEQPGNYSVQVVSENGCSHSAAVVIDFFPLLDLNVGNDTLICNQQTLDLSSNVDASAYLWSEGSTSKQITITKADTYWLQVTDGYACTHTDYIEVYPYDIPSFNLPPDTLLCSEVSLVLSAPLDDDFQYLWQDGSTDSYLEVDEEGYYWVEVSNLCGTSKNSIDITYRYCGEPIVPNVFSPNGDGKNDYFHIQGIDGEVWRLDVYNRWGYKVFERFAYNNLWQAEWLSNGVYFYTLSSADGKVYRGTFQIFR